MISPRLNPNNQALVIRLATTDDDLSLARLAELDSAEPPHGPQLLAEMDTQAVAALAMADGKAIADPFQPTADVVALLRLRAHQLRPDPAPGIGRGLARWAPAARQSIRHARNRLHGLLKGTDVGVQRLHRGKQPIEHHC